MDLLDPTVTEALRAWQTQLEAGIAASDALRRSATFCRSRAACASFEEAARRAEKGCSPSELLDALADVLSPGERAVLAAGFKSGRTDATLAGVVEMRELWARTRRTVRTKLLLPLAVLLIACFVVPLPRFVLTGDMVQYLLNAAALPALAVFAWLVAENVLQSVARREAKGTSTLDRLVLSLPVLGGVVRARHEALVAALLCQMIAAGMLLSDALAATAAALTNGVYREEFLRLSQFVRGGRPLTEALHTGRLWPPEFTAAVEVGEQSGTLEEAFRRLGLQARERYERRVAMLAEWMPRLLYALVALFIVINIFSMLGMLASVYSDALQGTP